MEFCLSIGWPVRMREAGVYDAWEGPTSSELIQVRGRRVCLALFLIWLLNGFDLVFTILAHQQGMLQEVNPVGNYLLGFGLTSIVFYKIGLVLIGSYPLLRFRDQHFCEWAAYLICAAYVALALQWSVCYELYLSSATSSIAYTR